ncbi:c-type cytochrome [Azospirillum sp. ST 5-10]|uniref:c-type cytochrome n=1 Tax=unclassified Azospirillum TaxID=2630922 RepID=UPI003F49CBA5
MTPRVAASLAALALLAACDQPRAAQEPAAAPAVAPTDVEAWSLHAPNVDTFDVPRDLGDPREGAEALRQYACITCHTVPGVVGPTPRTGPPLEGFAGRRYIAGVLPNTIDNFLRWVQAPQEVDPLTAMPDMGVKPEHARAMAAYLYARE